MRIAYNTMGIKLTKNQLIILSVFFTNLGKSYYLRELARMLGKEPGVIQRDINNLDKDGLLKSSFCGKSRFFELNNNHPLLKEIKSIVLKTTGLEKVLAGQLKELPDIQQAYIYGSFADGTADNFSDIDLIIVGRPDQEQLDQKLKILEKRFNREINYSVYSPAEYKKKIRTNDFLKEVLKTKTINLI